MVIDLRLFGVAGMWADQCRAALLAVARQGVALRGGGRQRVPLEPLECGMRRVIAPDPPPSVRSVQLHCLTPTLVRREQTVKGDAASLLYAAVTRAEGLAPWLGVRLKADLTRLRQAALQAETIRDERVIYRWTRHSQRQRDRHIEMMGWLGPLLVEGALSELAPYLMLAEATHLGSHAALGLGRVRVSLMP